MGGGGSEGGGGDGEGGGGDGGNLKRAPQSAQSVPNSHWATVPSSKSEPGPPSWQGPLFADAHVLVHHIGGGKGGGEGGGGEGGGGEGGGEGGGGEGGGGEGCGGEGGGDGGGGEGGGEGGEK